MEEYKVGEPLLETIDLKKYFKLKNGAQCCFANKLRKIFIQSAKKKRRLKGF